MAKTRKIKTLTADELDKLRNKLIADMQAAIDADIRQNLLNGWSPMTTSHYSSYNNVSPTDVEAKGKYPYQEPERDEQGTYYGYKVLIRRGEADMCGCDNCQTLVSPRYWQTGIWLGGELEADLEPREDTMSGIHFTKRPDHPELGRWYDYDKRNSFPDAWTGQETKTILVRCALSGTIAETEQGFRAQHAQITEVLINGNWTNYQDYSEHSRAHSRRVAPTWDEEQWKFIGGRWDTDRTSHP